MGEYKKHTKGLEIEPKLFNINKSNYGSDYNSHLFGQYKLYLQGIEKISDRRLKINNFFILTNTAMLSAIGLLLDDKFKFLGIKRPLFALIGVLICIVFWCLIRSYKQINTGKFTVLHEIESKLPLSLYKYEWKILGEGKNPKIYYPFSHIELLLPVVFGVTYILFGVLLLNL